MDPKPPGSLPNIEQAIQSLAAAMAYWQNPSLFMDGWFPLPAETWTYLSATTITVPAGASARYEKGDKVRIYQSGAAKYFYILSLTDTVLTVTGGTDYTVANATITSPAFSKLETPNGFPQYFAYTPTGTNITQGNGVYSGRFEIRGKTVKGWCQFLFGAAGSAVGTGAQLSLPATMSATLTVAHIIGTVDVLDNSTGHYPAFCYPATTTTVGVYIPKVDTVYALAVLTAAAVPMAAWAVSDAITAHWSYELA